MKKLTVLLLIFACVLALAGCSANDGQSEEAANADDTAVIAATETKPATEPTAAYVLDRESLEIVCSQGFIDPTKVTVLGGEWAYTADPNKFVALATVQYTDKDDEYETAEFVMVGVFGGEIELYHILNEHSPYTRENALQEFGAIDNRRFPLE